MDPLKALAEFDADACIAEVYSTLNFNFINLDDFYQKFLNFNSEDTNPAERLRLGEELRKTVEQHASDKPPKPGRKKKNAANKENETARSETEEPANETTGRPRRRAATNAAENISQQSNRSIKEKTHKDDNSVKTERISTETPPDVQIKQENVEMPPPAALPKRTGRKKKASTIKAENTSSRQTRSRTTNLSVETKSEDETETSSLAGKRSDVVLIQESLQTIHLDDTDEAVLKFAEAETEVETPNGTAKKPGRSKKDAAKGTTSPPSETKKPLGRPKRTKRKASSKNSDRSSAKSVYEDAVATPQADEVFATPEASKTVDVDHKHLLQLPVVSLPRLSRAVMDSAMNNANATITISKTAVMNETIVITKATSPNPNETVVIENPQVLNATVTLTKPTVAQLPNAEFNEIMTDDESDVEKTPPVAVKKAGTEQLMEEVENSAVKKKVEAFEKLVAASTTTRVTRTKTRQKAKASEAKKSEEEIISPPSSNPKAKACVTPVASIRIPALSAAKSNISNSAAKTLSGIKLSSQKYRDYELVRKEKEAEAQNKKQDILLKLSEEKRRRREEREQKARHQRAALEEEKLRLAEQQKAKEEKSKQLLAEKQDRMAKQREEAEKKRMLVKQKHEEVKREEERKRLLVAKKLEEEESRRVEEEKRQIEEQKRLMEEQKRRLVQMQKIAEPQQLPIYMRQKAPPLPTPDCYDSDDENAVRNPILPEWNYKEPMHQRMRCMSYVDAKLRNTLFCVKPQSANLQEMFPGVDPRKLKRNSSAIWSKAPRYTMMPQMNGDDNGDF